MGIRAGENQAGGKKYHVRPGLPQSLDDLLISRHIDEAHALRILRCLAHPAAPSTEERHSESFRKNRRRNILQIKPAIVPARPGRRPDRESFGFQPLRQRPADESARSGDENHAAAAFGPQANPKTYCAMGKNPVCTTSSFMEKTNTL